MNTFCDRGFGQEKKNNRPFGVGVGTEERKVRQTKEEEEG